MPRAPPAGAADGPAAASDRDTRANTDHDKERDMTGPSSTPRGERPGHPGTRWETALTTTEFLVPDDTWDEELPTPDRATRRAIARQRRGKRTPRHK